LKKLIKERNNIVHSKSNAVPDTYAEIKQIQKKDCERTISETVECLHKCIEGLQKVDTTNYWYFEEEVKHTVKFPTFRNSKTKSVSLGVQLVCTRGGWSLSKMLIMGGTLVVFLKRVSYAAASAARLLFEPPE
jgi:hypothetical protein